VDDMALKDVVMKDLITAMKEKDARKKGVLQLLKAGLDNAEKVKKSALEEAEEIELVQSELKQTKAFLVDARKLNRADLIQDAEAKIEIIYHYLPNQMSEDEVKAKLVELGVTKGMKMGVAMQIAMPELKGKTENALISKLVNQLIS
jgi:uncharacterized protein YqeY